MGRKINQQIDWMGLVDELKVEGQPKLPAYSRNLKENRIGGSTESFDPGGDTTAYSMNPGDFNMDIDVDTPDGWSDVDFGVPSSDPIPTAQWGLELFTKGARNARKFSKRLDDIVKNTNLKGSTRKTSPLYAPPSNTPISGISFQEYQAQQKLLADDWLKNLQLQNRPLTALPASSNVLDYYPIHRTDKSIIPKNEWPYAEWGLPPYSEKHYNKVTFKNGDIRFLNDWEIKNLPKTKEELRLRKQSEHKIMQIAPDTHTAFLKQDITNIEKNVQPPGNIQENVNVERGFVPNINIAPHQYPKDISLSSFNQNIRFPWNITDPYKSNIPSGVSPKGLATSLFDQASAEGLFKPGFQSWREEMIKENFVRDPISGELSSKEGSDNLKGYINRELGDLSQPFLSGPGGTTGYIGTSRDGIERLHQLMVNTGHTEYTGAQFNKMFPNEKNLHPDAVITFSEVTDLLKELSKVDLGKTIIPYGTSDNYNKMKFLFNEKLYNPEILPSLGNPPYDAQNYRLFQEGGSWDTIPPMIQDNTIVPLPNKLEIIEEDKPKLLDLNNIMNYIIETRGGDIDLWSGAADSIAYHESSAGQRMDPKAVQVSGNEETGFYDGPGRGMFQFEPSSLKTAQARYKNIADVTDFNIDQNILDVTDARDLSKKQQYTLFFANLIESDAVLKDFADGKLSLEDLWLQGHKNKETKGNRESFRASIEDAKNKGIKNGYSDFTLEELLSEKEGGELPKAQFGKGLRQFGRDLSGIVKNVFKNEKLSTLARTDPRRAKILEGKQHILNYYGNPINRDYEIGKISQSTGESRTQVALRLADRLEDIKNIDINLYNMVDDVSGYYTRGRYTDLSTRIGASDGIGAYFQNPFAKKRDIIALNEYHVGDDLNDMKETTIHELNHLLRKSEQSSDWSKLGSDYKPIYKGGQLRDQLKDIYYRTIGKPFRGNFNLKPDNQYYEPFNEQGIAFHPSFNVDRVSPVDKPFELSKWWNQPAEQQNMLATLRKDLLSKGFQKPGKDLTMGEFNNFIDDWYIQFKSPTTSYSNETEKLLRFSKYMHLLKDASALSINAGVLKDVFNVTNKFDGRKYQIMHERQKLLDAINKGFSEGGELPKAQFGKGLVNLMKKYKNWKPNIPFYNYTPYSGVKGDKIWNPFFERWEKSHKIDAIDKTKNVFLKEVADTKSINEYLQYEKQRIDEPRDMGLFESLFNIEKTISPYDEIELLQNIKGSMLPAFDTYLEGINAGRKFDRSMVNLYKSLPLNLKVAPGLFSDIFFPTSFSSHYDRLSKTWKHAREKENLSGPINKKTLKYVPRVQRRRDLDKKFLDYLDRRLDNLKGNFKPKNVSGVNPEVGGDFDIDIKKAMDEFNNPLPGAPQPQFQPFVNPQYYTDLEKYYIGRHGTGEGYGRNYPMNVSGSSDRLWLNAHNFKSGLEAMAYEMWLKSSRRNPLGLNIDKSTGLLDKLPSDNLSREKLSSDLQWTDRVWTPNWFNKGIPPGEMPDTPLRSTFINKRNLPWNLNEKGGELEKAQKGREVIETGIKLLNRLRKIKPTSKTTNETLYRSVLLNDAIRNSKMFKGMSDDDILEIMATTIPPNTNTYRKGQFFQTLNFANDIPSSLKHIGKYTDNPTGMWRIGDTPYDPTLPNLTNPKQDLGTRGIFGAPATGILGGDKFLLETTPYDDFPLLSAEDQNLLVKYAAEAEELGFHNKDITPIMKQFSFPAFRSEGINVMTGNFPQFIGVEGTPIGSLQNISLIDDALKEKYKPVIPKKKGSVSEGLTIEQWLEKHGNLFNQKKIKKDVLGNPIIPKKQEGGEPINDSFYSRDNYTSNASKYRRV
jgi:hypothetical protein